MGDISLLIHENKFKIDLTNRKNFAIVAS